MGGRRKEEKGGRGWRFRGERRRKGGRKGEGGWRKRKKDEGGKEKWGRGGT